LRIGPLFLSVLFYGTEACLGMPALRPYRGFLAQHTALMDLWECIQWGVGECAAWWSKLTRRVSVKWCRGRNWGALCSTD